VVAVGGDVVGMVDGRLHLNSAPVDEPYAYHSDSRDEAFPSMRWQVDHLFAPDSIGSGPYDPTARSWGPIRVPEGTTFVLGDHRNASFDSRHRGPTPVQDVTGRLRRVYFSRSPSDGVRWSRLGAWVR
jgi:signal peptidase I